MKDTNNTPKDNKLDPEIKNKAEELFDLIEEQFIKDDKTCKTAEGILMEMGEMLRFHRGMEELVFAYEMSRTKSEEAEYSLERSVHFMTNDALKKLYDLSRCSIELIECLEGDRPESHLSWRIKEIKQIAPNILGHATSEFIFRAGCFRDEIEKLKEAS